VSQEISESLITLADHNSPELSEMGISAILLCLHITSILSRKRIYCQRRVVLMNNIDVYSPLTCEVAVIIRLLWQLVGETDKRSVVLQIYICLNSACSCSPYGDFLILFCEIVDYISTGIGAVKDRSCSKYQQCVDKFRGPSSQFRPLAHIFMTKIYETRASNQSRDIALWRGRFSDVRYFVCKRHYHDDTLSQILIHSVSLENMVAVQSQRDETVMSQAKLNFRQN
jgi:hypothetical protein